MQSRILLRGYAREGGTPSLATHPQNQQQHQEQNQNQEQHQNQNQQQNQGRLHRGLDTPAPGAADPTAGSAALRKPPESAHPHLHYPGSPSPSPRRSPCSSACTPCRLMNGPS